MYVKYLLFCHPGFGGSSKLPEVKDRAKWFITDFRDLIKEL
jgi:hypothetical protein